MFKNGKFLAVFLIIPIAYILFYIFVSNSFPTNLFVLFAIFGLATLFKVHKKVREEYTTTLICLAFAMGFLYFPVIRQPKIISTIELTKSDAVVLYGIYRNEIDRIDLSEIDSVTTDKTFMRGRSGGPYARYELNLFVKGKKYTSAEFE